MKAHEFVVEHGIEKAKRVLNNKPHSAEFFNITGGYDRKSKKIDFNSSKIHVNLMELKQVVESVGLIDSYGGITKAKSLCNCFSNACKSAGVKKSPRLLALQKAIADYELVESIKEKKSN